MCGGKARRPGATKTVTWKNKTKTTNLSERRFFHVKIYVCFGICVPHLECVNVCVHVFGIRSTFSLRISTKTRAKCKNGWKFLRPYFSEHCKDTKQHNTALNQTIHGRLRRCGSGGINHF